MNGTAPYSPMLLSELKTPFHREDWVYEEKYVGYRILAVKADGQVTLWSRNGKDLTRWFRGIAQAISDEDHHPGRRSRGVRCEPSVPHELPAT